jgi:hypothetical protein
MILLTIVAKDWARFFFFMEHLVISSIWTATLSSSRCLPFPECFLHFNANNDNACDGWMTKGFVPVFGPTNFVVREVAFVRNRYQGLALSLLAFLIFKASYRDTVNCASMYTKFGFLFEDHSSTPLSPVQNDPHAWYSDYSSALSVLFVANYPSTPVYHSLDVAEIKAKYSSKSTDTSSAAFWSIIEMAYSRKPFCLDPSSPDDQQKSVSSPNDASVLSAKDDADEDAELIPKSGGQKRRRLDDKHSKTSSHIHSTFSDQDYINYACVQDPARKIRVDPKSLVKNGSEKIVKLHVSSYLLPETILIFE